MRVWHIPMKYLDDRRLTAQHNEIHGLTTCVMTGQKWGSVSEQFKGHLWYLRAVHESAVDEIRIRTMLKGRFYHAHKSPYPEVQDLGTAFTPSKDDLIKDVQNLRDKWAAEGYYFGTGRHCLTDLEKELGLPLGLSTIEAGSVRTETQHFVKKHRDTLNRMKGTLGRRLLELRGPP